MSNQIVISSGAKVRNLDGVLTGTSGIVNSVPLGAANGVATLDSGGKVPVSQLPSSVVTYLGTWNAATNTPTLTNGTGDAGDMYLCNVAGTVNFGAGPITFAVGDWVLYGSGTWQKSNGQNGTVTSVAVTESGDALTITGSPITTAGTINIGFAGDNTQYINGAGNLTTFPSLAGYVTSVTATAPLLSSGGTTPDLSIPAASASVDGYLDNADWTTFNNKQNAITLTTTGTTGAATLIGATLNIPNYSTDLSGYVPYTGATGNVNLGTHSLSAYDLIINHTSGSGVAASITKGGSGEALTVVKSSGSGNAASITGGVTLLDELHLTTDLADAYIASAANWNTAYTNRITSATSPLNITSNVISISLANTTTSGYLSSTDWNTFNGKQNALTNPVTGTGNNNYIAKFSSTGSTIANSLLQSDASNVFINQENTSFGVDAQALIRLGFVKKSGLDPTIAYAEDPFTISSTAGTSIDASNTFVTRFSMDLNGAATFSSSIAATSANFSGPLTATKGTFSGNTSEPLRIERTAGPTIYGKFSLAISASSNFSIYDAVADADRLIITSTGNVGIFDNAPALKLSVRAADAPTTPTLGTASGHFIIGNGASTISYGLMFGVNGDGNSWIQSQRIDATATAYNILLQPSGGHIGVGVTPSAWASPFKVIQIGTYGQFIGGQTNGPDIKIGSNTYYNGSNYIYTTSTSAVLFNVGGFSGFQFSVADVGVAGEAVTFTQAMSINRNGNVVIGSITDNGNRLQVTGSSTISGNVLIGTTTALQSNEKVGIETDTNTALITKFTGGAATGWAAKFWNNATTGDNFLIEFLTEASITARGSIKYDRAGNRLNILGAGSGLLFTGASTFANSAKIGGGLNITGYTNSSGANNWEIGSDADGYYINAINRTTGNYNKPAYFDAQKLIFNSGSTGNVLINTSTNVSGGGALQVNGNVNINGVFQINGVTIGGGGGSGVTGSGTTNYIPKWTGSTSLGNSVIQDTGTNVGIGAAPLSFTRLYVTDTGANITGGNAIAGTSIKGVMIENSNNADESIGLWFRTGNNHLSGISGQRFNSATGWGTDLRFYTHEEATTDLTYTRERMRITAEGSVLIGTRTDVGSGYKLQVAGSINMSYGGFFNFRGSSGAGDVLVDNSGSTLRITGNVSVAGSVTASGGFFDTSDSRLKVVIKDYNKAKGIENVEARLYLKNNKKELGYFAQDVKEVLPSAVGEDTDGYLTLSYSQVHTAKIAYLEEKVAQLEELIKSLIK